LREAEEIKNDAEKMTLVKPFLKKEIKSIEDLKELISSDMEIEDGEE
jgi:glutamate synthase domain-containing protein 2